MTWPVRLHSNHSAGSESRWTFSDKQRTKPHELKEAQCSNSGYLSDIYLPHTQTTSEITVHLDTKTRFNSNSEQKPRSLRRERKLEHKAARLLRCSCLCLQGVRRIKARSRKTLKAGSRKMKCWGSTTTNCDSFEMNSTGLTC